VQPDEQTSDTAPGADIGSGAPQTSPAVAAPRASSSDPESDQPAAAGEHNDADGDELRQTFDREYVEKLRRSEAGYRQRARRADALGAALVTSYAELTGKLADASDLPYSDELCDEHGVPDEQKVRAAVDDLLARKPHLASRRPAGDVGQGARVGEPDGVSLAGLLRAGAG
jgi:hypothetical protein